MLRNDFSPQKPQLLDPGVPFVGIDFRVGRQEGHHLAGKRVVSRKHGDPDPVGIDACRLSMGDHEFERDPCRAAGPENLGSVFDARILFYDVLHPKAHVVSGHDRKLRQIFC